ncbi:hypothetical protein ACFUN8_11825 [Streptomyces sp. NPDC057307]|uniref:hypothetical protein n=1 Tax=Streptomyces sp. NPDC057307 TaxID=3346096 RepID=UPI00363DE3F1
MTKTEGVPHHIAATDIERADLTLNAMGVGDSGYRGVGWSDQLLGELRELPSERRRSLAHFLVERCQRLDVTSEFRARTLLLAGVLAADLPGDPLAAERVKVLDDLGECHSFWYEDHFSVLVEAELAAGRSLTPAAIAAFRRSGMEYGFPAAPLVRAGEKPTDPVLNVGEKWAERALEQVGPGPDDPWRALLAHALTAKSARPSAKWDRLAGQLVEPLGPEPVREKVVSWLALVGVPRTFRVKAVFCEDRHFNEVFDPYNALALRGLAWLLSLLPPHADAARALGALVDTSLEKLPGRGPRSEKVAHAGALALGRVDSESAPAELDRLAARVTHKATAKVIATAREAHATRSHDDRTALSSHPAL